MRVRIAALLVLALGLLLLLSAPPRPDSSGQAPSRASLSKPGSTVAGAQPVTTSQQRSGGDGEQNDWEHRVAERVLAVRRLPVDAFPELPPAVASLLRDRKCMVPQPVAESAPRNVVRGEFFAPGQAAWAVLCSVDHTTTLLVFESDRDRSPAVLATSEDGNYASTIHDGIAVYQREITAVGREFIEGHYRAYGGPKPPPIHHSGIDDAFLEKASITWYFHEGEWLKLTGAD